MQTYSVVGPRARVRHVGRLQMAGGLLTGFWVFAALPAAGRQGCVTAVVAWQAFKHRRFAVDGGVAIEGRH